jgi:uncharacterized protein YaiI (UPF0178 family)
LKVWVDADACPVVVRDIIARAVHKRALDTVLVANGLLAVPESKWISFVQVASGPDIADAYIAERVEKGDLVVTQDIPLAAAVVAKGALALTPRGQLYTADNVSEALASRDLMSSLRDAGTVSGGVRPFDERARREFANAFHGAIERLTKR